jgi:hypothetical protein
MSEIRNFITSVQFILTETLAKIWHFGSHKYESDELISILQTLSLYRLHPNQRKLLNSKIQTNSIWYK